MTPIITEHTAAQLASSLELLKSHGFKVCEPFDTPPGYGTPRNGEVVSLGAVVDTETTGLDPEKDAVVELSLVVFEYSASTGEVFDIVGGCNQLQDPGFPMPAEASKINGITDEMLQGKAFDFGEIVETLQGLSVLIAHNAGYDRKLCERLHPLFKEIPWACSLKQIDWSAEDISSGKLEFIAFKKGFYYPPHRAEMDCRALLHVLQGPMLDNASTYLKALLDKSAVEEKRIWAIGAPFDAKDMLRARGYQWSDGNGDTEKAWSIALPVAEVSAELEWLKAEVFRNRTSAVIVDDVNGLNRFSNRRAGSEKIYL
jgi:DNA polymerase-3 subunit epsilon